MRILLVDDDSALRELLRTTFEVVAVEVAEAEDAASARRYLMRSKPDVMVLDVSMPGENGLSLCHAVKSNPDWRSIGVVLLTGSDQGGSAEANAAGADAFLRKPFSPLELLGVVERLGGARADGTLQATRPREADEQLTLYAKDLRRLLEIERGQRILLESAYQETVGALASALESKDTGTREHSQRVQRYAMELAREARPELIDDAGTEYGFLLHDVGKIGVPDGILQKPGPLTESERSLMETHTVLGEQMLGGVAVLQGEGLKVVRHHHERWDGAGYPDGLCGTDIPVGARIFAVADALDAMTSDRPYRRALDWYAAGAEIISQSKEQFDPYVVQAFREAEPRLRAIHRRFAHV
ncbi:MAG TPA: HD domain-containing phosphohydrolase [Gaiellaceae bacterium]|nr:HD domain-containing phosphohydrolase [Gaiellaceae bacterium]